MNKPKIFLNKKKFFITWNRSLFIVPKMFGKTFVVYNGKKHIPIFINKYMLGHKLGEFAITLKIKKY